MIQEIQTGPARVLIMGGFGFSRGTKTNERYDVAAFSQIPRYTSIT